MAHSLSVADFPQTCRACLTTEPTQELRSLTDTLVHQLFAKYTFLEVSPDDTLPQNICVACVQHCELGLEFRNACIQNEQLLLEVAALGLPTNDDDCHSTTSGSDTVAVSVATKKEEETESNDKRVPNETDHQLASQGGDTSGLRKKRGRPPKIRPEKEPKSQPISTRATQKKALDNIPPKPKLKRGEGTGDQIHDVTCQYCGTVCNGWRSLEDHIRVLHMKETVHSCRQCNRVYGRVAALRSHMYRHSGYKWRPRAALSTRERGEKPPVLLLRGGQSIVECQLCRQTFTDMTLFSVHFNQEHNDEKSYDCGECKITISPAYRIKDHMFEHSDFRFPCPHCEEQLRTPLQYHKHLMKLHPKHMCDICGATCQTKTLLEDHRRRHSGDRPFPCEVCGKTFKMKKTLQTHAAVHKEKTFFCGSCTSAFKTNQELKVHLKVMHLNYRPHVCSVCSKGYITPYDLRMHMRIHTGERPYKCQLCPATFARPEKMRNHQSLHSGEKPHVCEICHKSFRVMWTLTAHLKTHNKG